MRPQVHQGVINSWNILKYFLKEAEIVKNFNRWNPLSSKTQIKRIKDPHIKKREESKGEAPVASTREPQARQPLQEVKKKKKETGGSHIPPATGSQE
ncbi:hypothetical protein O181_096456 [Austropuccinia psidii MF-1]|uniref:Uncharacterized protein n=1 Tax=Austropuccinia psidii MF-1 TaxID=1389203 RepID=A0A9Q3J7F7_9BASI|nr:hypothetical protein [Austropuccinia psidii MF-1]